MARGSSDSSGEAGKPGQLPGQSWRGPRHKGAAGAFPPVPTPPLPALCADELKHPQAPVQAAAGQEDNQCHFPGSSSGALRPDRGRNKHEEVFAGYINPTRSLAQPFSLFSSSRLIIKFSYELQISVSQQPQQQNKSFCELGGIFIPLQMASRGTPSVKQIFFFFPS